MISNHYLVYTLMLLLLTNCIQQSEINPLDLVEYDCELTDDPSGCILISSLDSAEVNARIQGSWRVLIAGGGWEIAQPTPEDATFRYTLDQGNVFSYELPDGSSGVTTYSLSFYRNCFGEKQAIVLPEDVGTLRYIPIFYELCQNDQYGRHNDLPCDGGVGEYCRLQS